MFWKLILGESGGYVVTDASDSLECERDLLSDIVGESIFHVMSGALLQGISIFLSEVSRLQPSFFSKSSPRNPELSEEKLGSTSLLQSMFIGARPVLLIIDIDACRMRLSCGIVKLVSFVCTAATGCLPSKGSIVAKERLGVKFDFSSNVVPKAFRTPWPQKSGVGSG